MDWVRRSYWLAGAGVLASVLAGCGMPGVPQPPSLDLPQTVRDLAAIRTGDHVSLTWTTPTKNTDKLLLKDKVQARVCRAQGASHACQVAGQVSFAPGAAGAFSEELPEELATGTPRTLRYFVELRNRSGRSAGLSSGAEVLAGEAPSAVSGLDAEVRKEGVVLHWKAAIDGPAATAIRLRRRLLTPVATPPQRQGVLTPPPEQVEQNLLIEVKGQEPDRTIDKDIRFGAAYEYRAQRVIRVEENGTTMELDGPFSAPVRVEAADIFPPAVPTGLAAVSVPAENGHAPAIDLSWQPNTEPDLAGYVVYRRENGGAWQRISPAPGPGYHDAHVEAGHAYEYAVSAVDQGGHESGRSEATTETVPEQ